MKTAVVTGASKGLGKNLVMTLVNAGWYVIGISRNLSTIDHVNYKHLIADISNASAVINAFNEIHGTVELLINNAAIFEMARFDNTSLTSISDIINTNVVGTMNVTHQCIPLMHEGSKIVFINSVAGTVEIENQSVYCASKFALTAFAGVLGKELRSKKIKIISVHPGGINTGLWNKDNPYPCGNATDALDPQDISDLIMVMLNSNNIEFKQVKLFPDIEWH